MSNYVKLYICGPFVDSVSFMSRKNSGGLYVKRVRKKVKGGGRRNLGSVGQ